MWLQLTSPSSHASRTPGSWCGGPPGTVAAVSPQLGHITALGTRGAGPSVGLGVMGRGKNSSQGRQGKGREGSVAEQSLTLTALAQPSQLPASVSPPGY